MKYAVVWRCANLQLPTWHAVAPGARALASVRSSSIVTVEKEELERLRTLSPDYWDDARSWKVLERMMSRNGRTVEQSEGP